MADLRSMFLLLAKSAIRLTFTFNFVVRLSVKILADFVDRVPSASLLALSTTLTKPVPG